MKLSFVVAEGLNFHFIRYTYAISHMFCVHSRSSRQNPPIQTTYLYKTYDLRVHVFMKRDLSLFQLPFECIPVYINGRWVRLTFCFAVFSCGGVTILADWQATTKSKNHFFLFSTKTLVASKPYQGVDLMTKHGGGLERFVCSKPHKKLYILRSHLPKNSTRPLASVSIRPAE